MVEKFPSQPKNSTPSPERQPLPSVWDVLERSVKLAVKGNEVLTSHEEFAEYNRERREAGRLKSELKKRGTDRDRLILDLYTETTIEPANFPVPIDFVDLSPEKFQQFRTKVEVLSEDDIRGEIRQAKEEYERKAKAHPGRRPPPPGSMARV